MRGDVKSLVRMAAAVGIAACGGKAFLEAEPAATPDDAGAKPVDDAGSPPADDAAPNDAERPLVCGFDASFWGREACGGGVLEKKGVHPIDCDAFDGGALREDICRDICADAGVLYPAQFHGCSPTLTEAGGPGAYCWTCGVPGRAPEGLRRGNGMERDERPSLVRALTSLAELEAVSVPAFEILRAELAAHGAPNDLLARADRARKDEIRHARTMARLARRHGGDPRPPRIGRRCLRSLRAIARENAVEGCVRETFGAMVAQVQAARAADPAIKRAMKRIAIDEASHAELSWDVARFCDGQLEVAARREVREAVVEALASLRAEIEHEPPVDVRVALGLPTGEESREMLGALAKELAA